MAAESAQICDCRQRGEGLKLIGRVFGKTSTPDKPTGRCLARFTLAIIRVLCHGSVTMKGILRILAALAAIVANPFLAYASPAHRPAVVRVPHGMVVNTMDGEMVRVLAFRDGTVRVTVAPDPDRAAQSFMVVAEADGEPAFASSPTAATLTTAHSRAEVRLSDGRLRVFDAAGKLLLDEYAPARRLTPVTIEGQSFFATRAEFNRGTDEGLYGLGQHQNRQMN